MLNPKFCVKEISRLAGLGGFPTQTEARQELVKALQSADNEAMAVAIVNDWLHEQEFAPRPVNLYRAITEERERRNIEAIPSYTEEPRDPVWEAQFQADCEKLMDKIRRRNKPHVQ